MSVRAHSTGAPRARRGSPPPPAPAAPRLIAEVDGGLRLEFAVGEAASARALLATTHALPLNLRWTRRRGDVLLMLDLAPRSAAREEIAGLAALLAAAGCHGGARAAPLRSMFDVADLRARLRRQGVPDTALVSRPDALELRLPTADQVRAVLIDADGDALHLQSVALSDVDASDREDPAGAAAVGAVSVDAVLFDQALRCNAAVRFARLALTGTGIVAEAHVAAGDDAFLLRTARAVAALAHDAGPALATLHDHPEVRAAYARLVLGLSTSRNGATT